MSTYKLLIQYNDDAYEKLVVSVNRYISKVETEYLGDIMITTNDINEAGYGSEVIPTIDRDLYNRLDYSAREYIVDYTVNMYNTMNNMFLYKNSTFTGIEVLEIKEED